MALAFSSASGALVNCGSAASLDNLQGNAAGFTVVAWIMRTADGYDKAIVSKFTSASAGWVLFCEGVPPGYSTYGGLRMQVLRGTGFGDQTTYETSDRITKDAWMFVAGTFKDSATPKMHLYYGSLTATVVEETSYQLSSAGTGTLNSDAATNLLIGDGQDNLDGRIQRVGIYNTELSLAEIKALQFAPVSQWNRPDCVLLTELADASKTQADLSGDGNNGSVTSATDAAGLPLGATYAQAAEYRSYVVTVTAYTLVAGQGSYALTGQAAGLKAGRMLAAAQGSYSVNGQTVGLTYSGAGPKTLTVEQGSYLLTGQTSALRVGRGLVAAQGSYAKTGQTVSLRGGRVLMLAQGSYALAGSDALVDYAITMAQGGYALTGQAVALRATRKLTAAYGTYTHSGVAVGLNYSAAPPVVRKYNLPLLGAGD